MADHILQTTPSSDGIIICLRYDTYSHWMNSDRIPYPGEVAIAAFPNTNPLDPPRAIGIKVGDGRHYFDELPWIQGIAMDVFDWAKTANKPIYTANEIEGLAEYIAAHSSSSGGGGSGSGSYQIIWDASSSKYILQQWNEAENDWENTASNIDFSNILTRLNNIERWANGATTQLGNIYDPLDGIVQDNMIQFLSRYDVNDTAVAHEFVTAVQQVDGKIRVSRAPLKATDITDGVLSTTYGGTGLNRVEDDEVLVGSAGGTITTRNFTTEINTNQRSSFATSGAIIDYVAEKTAGITGAMHFVGEALVTVLPNSRVDPQIVDYNFRNAQMGDVILANNSQELVWTGSEWRLLGDEGSYAIKGSIVNADIADNANIAQSKINGLADTLDNKVTVVEGKDLSSNDYTDEDKEKLDTVEYNAQENIIEHVYLNDEEVIPRTVSGNPKTVDLHFNGMTEEQGAKLDGIEAGAEVNVIEHIQLNGTEIQPQNKIVNIELVEYTQNEKDKLGTVEEYAQENKIAKIYLNGDEVIPDQDKIVYISADNNIIEGIYINGTEYPPDNNKIVRITLDQAALNLSVIEGARYPTGPNTYANVDITNDKKLELSRIAATGDAQHLLQELDTYITLDCGSSTDVI